MMSRMLIVPVLMAGMMSTTYAATTQDVQQFVNLLSGKIITVLKETQNNLPARQQAFKDIFHESADVATIARFVSGAAWRTATPQQQQDYVQTYADYMAYTYASRINAYNEQSVQVGRITPLGKNGYLVYTQIQQANQPKPLAVTWQISDKAGLKVTDLRIENISMSLTQKAEFMALLAQNNNSLTGLTALLQKRIGR